MTSVRAMMTAFALIAAALIAAGLLFATCSGSSGNRIQREPLTIVAANGTTAHLDIEVAETDEERAVGLMGRDEVPLDTGMLFVIPPPGRGFWMKDTRLKLTVAFIGECGEILDFADLEPLSEEIKNTDKPYFFALEVDQGWFARNGIALGDIVSLPKRLKPDGC